MLSTWAIDVRELFEEYARGTPAIAHMLSRRTFDVRTSFEEYAWGTPTNAMSRLSVLFIVRFLHLAEAYPRYARGTP